MPGDRRGAATRAERRAAGGMRRRRSRQRRSGSTKRSSPSFLARLQYIGGDAEDEDRSTTGCATRSRARSSPSSTSRRRPSMFDEIAEELAEAGLVGDTSRLVVEKPFGTDLASARDLNRRLTAIFPEERLFRIDHFLGKEPVQDIMYLRFANALFEPIWNREHVDVDPDHDGGGLRRRGSRRVLRPGRRDARRRPEPPAAGARARRDGAAVGRRRRDPAPTAQDVFRAMPRVDPREAVRGQYAGYRDIEGVEPGSDTETFVALRLEIENWRWAGVPILVRAGKALPVTATEIVIRLQRVPELQWGGHRLYSPGLRRHRPAHRAPRGDVDLRPREDTGQGGLAARLARSRLRGGAGRAAAAVRAAARGCAARRSHALPAMERDRGDVAHRAAAARRSACRSSATSRGRGGRPPRMRSRPRTAAGASRSRHRSTR